MKKKLLCLLSTVFVVNCLAQIKVATTCNIAIGSITTPGTNTINFTTNGAEAMRINSSGIVGIGTTSPSSLYKLDVTGAMHASSQANVFGSFTGSMTSPTNSNTNVLLYYSTSTNWSGIGSHSDGSMYFVTGTSSPASRLTISPTGDIGIGTTGPGAKLDVAGNVNIGTSNKYQINGSNFLWTNNISGCLYIGINACNASSTGTNNTYGGKNAGTANSTSSNNSAFGYNTLAAITSSTGSNSAFGGGSLQSNTSGYVNAAFGYSSLSNNTTGYANSAFGDNAGNVETTGTYNTFIGYGANTSSAGSWTNATAIGNGATVNASNKVRVGNSTVSVIEGQCNWTSISDKRFKTNIKEEVKGLEFIKKLRPVIYQFDAATYDQFLMKNMPDSIKQGIIQGTDYATAATVIHTGFIAQEVEQAAIACNYKFDGVHIPTDINSDNYGLAYAEFVVPLVKAAQELSRTVDSLTTISIKQDSINQVLQAQINTCCSKSQSGMKLNNSGNNFNAEGNNPTTKSNSLNEDSKNSTEATLFQNIPNPFNQQTSIQYFIPTGAQSASIMVFDLQGKLVKTFAVTNFGKGAITINGNELNPGMFMYSLIIDGKEIDTKRMILTQ